MVLLLANVGLVLLLVQPNDDAPDPGSGAADAATTSARTTSSSGTGSTPPTTSGSATATETSSPGGVLAVYGDGYASGNLEGGEGAAGWRAVTAVFGSRNDVSAAPAEVQAAATATFQAILAADPTTELVVIGPAWSSSDAPAELAAVSDAVQSAAAAAGATYVEPLTLGWFADPVGLVSLTDGILLLDAGHVYLAQQIASLVGTARSS